MPSKQNARPKPPEGYETWLDYAVATMDTRQASIEKVIHDSGDGDRDKMTRAVVAELADLRAKADKWDERCEVLLRLCHNAPMAVGMDTRSIDAAVRRLVDFAWECVQGESRDETI